MTRRENTRQPIMNWAVTACHPVNSVYKQTEDTHTHTPYTQHCYDEDDEDYYDDNNN